jgi:putative transposase
MFLRERTAFPVVLYGLYLVFLGLSFRAVSLALRPFVLRSHVAVWKWAQRLPCLRKLYTYRCRVSLFLVDETAVMVGGFPAWVWMAYEPLSRRILGPWLSWTRNSLQAEKFLKTLVRLYGRHPVWTDGAPWYSDACRSLGLEHYRYRFGEWLHTVMERAIQSLKDRVECFDDSFPCSKKGCSLQHVRRWLNLYQLLSQPENQRIIQNIRGVIKMV